MSDVRLAVRALAGAPLVTLVVILSLALGIGANAAMFALVDSLLLRALPLPHPERLATVAPHDRGPWWPYAAWQAIHARRTQIFGDATAFRSSRFNLAPIGAADMVDALMASGNFFEVVGASAWLGRTFTEQDDAAGGPDGAVAVLGHEFWRRRFGAAPDVIGRTLIIERVPFTIVGVTPPGFFGVEVGRRFDVAIPLETDRLINGAESSLDRRGTSGLRILARLAPNQTLAQAERALRGVQPQIRELSRNPAAGPVSQRAHFASPFVVRSGESGVSLVREPYRQPMLVIMAVAALVLLVACANLANLFMARTAALRHELSVRRALGASRWRLARQVLIEILLVSAAGAAAGLLVAQAGSGLLVRQLSTQMNVVFLDVRIDWRLVAFTCLIALTSTLLAGVVPAWRAASGDAIDAMRSTGRGATPDRRVGLAGMLVVAQVALSLVLVVAAGLFLRTFQSLLTLDAGFDRDRVLIVSLDTRGAGVDPSRRAALFDAVLERVRQAPGVAEAALSSITPVSGMVTDFGVEIEGAPPPGEITLLTPGVLPLNAAYINSLTPGWFATYGTRLVAGRDFDARDGPGAPPVAIVNETFARRLLPGVHPVGRRFRSAFTRAETPNPWIEIVGVVRDATYVRLRDELPSTFYVPMAQWIDRPGREMPATLRLSVRAASGAPAALTRVVSEAIDRVDPAISTTFMTLSRQIDDSLTRERLLALLAGSFGGLALLLAALGLYGVLSHAVGRRRREIGIRMALGARPGDVARMVAGRALLLVVIGIAAGTGCALMAARFVRTLLYDVTSNDLTTLVTSALVLTTVGVAAAWLPARRAARIDPARVLQTE